MIKNNQKDDNTNEQSKTNILNNMSGKIAMPRPAIQRHEKDKNY